MKSSLSILFKKFFFSVVMSLFIQVGIAQEQGSQFWSNVRFGGGIGLSFGNEFFSGTIAPSAIYEFNEQIAAGLGGNFSYNSQKDVYKTTIVGGSVLGFYNVIPELQLSTEFEQLYVSRTYESDLQIPNNSYWYPALFVGAGYRAGNFTAGIRYDVLYDEDENIYASAWMPFVRVYF